MYVLRTLDDLRAALATELRGTVVRCTYRDAVTGSGLDAIFPSYAVVTTHESKEVEAQRARYPVISLESLRGAMLERTRGTDEYPLLDAGVREAVRRLPGPRIHLLPYALSAEEHAAAVGEGWNVCAVTPRERILLDRRDTFLDIAREADLAVPRTEIVDDCSARDIEAFFRKHGPCVVQELSEAAGLGTAFVRTPADMAAFGGRPSRRALAVFEEGLPVSCEACVLEDEVVVSPPRMQIMGCPELAAHPALFCGNEWNIDMPGLERSALQDMARRTAGVLRARGYRGIFGIDALWNPASRRLLALELNPRLLGTTQLYALQQADVGEPALLGLHVLAFLGIPAVVPEDVRSGIAARRCTASQIILRNTEPHAVAVRGDLLPGIYRLGSTGPAYLRPACSYNDLREADEVLVTMVPPRGKRIGVSAQIVRAQFRSACYDAASRALLPRTSRFVEWLRAQLHLAAA